MIPKDPAILLSYVNTQLRNYYADLDAFCEDQEVDAQEIREKLRVIGYEYDEKRNQFIYNDRGGGVSAQYLFLKFLIDKFTRI